MRIGFIGLGNIGGPMALRVVKGGYRTTVFDIKRDTAEPHLKAGATWADSAAALAAAFITRPSRPAPARPALIQTPVPHLACPVAVRQAPGQTRSPERS